MSRDHHVFKISVAMNRVQKEMLIKDIISNYHCFSTAHLNSSSNYCLMIINQFQVTLTFTFRQQHPIDP